MIDLALTLSLSVITAVGAQTIVPPPLEKYNNVSIDLLIGELIQKNKVLLSVKAEIARLSAAYPEPEKDLHEQIILPDTLPDFEKFDNMTADQLIREIMHINKALQISKAEMVRLSYVEVEKNPKVSGYISKEHLQKMIEEENNNLYYYTEDEFSTGNKSTPTIS
ncbi:uncharacterized protein LOC135845814 [Planococcus citri]|uniref:uncharacterized protein LOC135845814 n=1 Tax=Planococcus citri TaxID=170843 RepID=UPI0031F84989